MLDNVNFPKWEEGGEILPQLISAATTLKVYHNPRSEFGFSDLWLKHNFTGSIPSTDDYDVKASYLINKYISFMRDYLKVDEIYKEYESSSAVIDDPSILRDLIIIRIKDYQSRGSYKFKEDMARYVLGRPSLCGTYDFNKTPYYVESPLLTVEGMNKVSSIKE